MTAKEYKYIKHSDKQRAMILETAKKLFMENEIKDVSMTQIARECGITRATLYRYFENKDAVVWEIYISFGKKWMDTLWGEIHGKKYLLMKNGSIPAGDVGCVYRDARVL